MEDQHLHRQGLSICITFQSELIVLIISTPFGLRRRLCHASKIIVDTIQAWTKYIETYYNYQACMCRWFVVYTTEDQIAV